MAALSAIALRSLHQDKASIEREARDRAQIEMPEIARAFRNTMHNLHPIARGEIRDGQTLAVPDYSPQPDPGSPRVSLKATEALHALELAERAGEAGLISQAVDLAHRFPEADTPSGTPISGLALLLALRHTAKGPLPADLRDEVRRNVMEFPSFLAPELLSAAKVAEIEQEWDRREADREKMRELVRTAAGQLIGATGLRSILIPNATGRALALCSPSPNGWDITFYADAVASFFDSLKPLPLGYAGVMLQLDGAQWRSLVGNESTILASTSGVLDTPSPHAFVLSLYLADPDLLYATYHERAKFTQWLIVSAAVTAMIGLASLWMGYRREVRLGRMKSNFVSSVSHELRAPLAAVRLMAESLESGRVSDEPGKRNYYRLIVQECSRLTGLVENVLDLSRMGDGRKNYSFEPVDLPALMRQSVALMEPCAAERQVTLRLEDTPGELQPAWDGHAVEQSLVNLLDNAIKHSPPGAEVRVLVERDNGNLRLWVEDRGPGIPAREQKRIFELFHRHGSELRRETKGAGIGLTIVRHVAEAHGGRVIVDSEVGRGSRFALELPMEHRS